MRLAKGDVFTAVFAGYPERRRFTMEGQSESLAMTDGRRMTGRRVTAYRVLKFNSRPDGTYEAQCRVERICWSDLVEVTA